MSAEVPQVVATLDAQERGASFVPDEKTRWFDEAERTLTFITRGTFTGTLNVDILADDGSTWVRLTADRTDVGVDQIRVPRRATLSVNMSAYTSGTATVSVQ